MKRIVLVVALSLGLATPSFAWYDSYGGFTCGYLDPLTSFLDSIFGPPCPPPVAVVQPAPVVVEREVPVAVPQPVPVPVPQPVPVPMGGPAPFPMYPCGYGCY